MTYLLSLLISIAHAETIKVAILDTGFNMKYKNQVNLCKSGHKDFTNTGLNDSHGHGTNISGLIHKNAGKSDYCQLIIKFFKENSNKNQQNILKSLEYLLTIDVDVINFSAGGPDFNKKEAYLVKKLLNKGVIFIAAAGNDGKNLDKHTYYPAMIDKRIIVVGNTAKSSNYGKVVDIIVDGNNKTALGYTMSGSSQSTAIVTGTVIKILEDL